MRVGGARPPPLFTFTITSKVAVYAPAENMYSVSKTKPRKDEQLCIHSKQIDKVDKVYSPLRYCEKHFPGQQGSYSKEVSLAVITKIIRLADPVIHFYKILGVCHITETVMGGGIVGLVCMICTCVRVKLLCVHDSLVLCLHNP